MVARQGGCRMREMEIFGRGKGLEEEIGTVVHMRMDMNWSLG